MNARGWTGRSAWFLVGVAAVASWSCGEGPVRPEPPSPPPLTAKETPAVAADDPRQEPVPVSAPREEAETQPPREAPAPPEPVPAQATESAPDPIQWMQDRAAREEDRRVRLAEAERKVSESRERVTELEQRLLAVKNPFLPRPVLPPDEAKAWEGLDGAQRAARVEAQLAEAREEAAAAENARNALKGR